MASQESHSLKELVSSLGSDISGLFRKEIDLAKAEASANISNVASGLAMFAVGLVLAVGAIGVLLTAIVSGLGALLVSQGFSEASADAIASMVIAVVVSVLAWVVISRGIAIVRQTSLTLPRTANALHRDADVVKERLS